MCTSNSEIEQSKDPIPVATLLELAERQMVSIWILTSFQSLEKWLATAAMIRSLLLKSCDTDSLDMGKHPSESGLHLSVSERSAQSRHTFLVLQTVKLSIMQCDAFREMKRQSSRSDLLMAFSHNSGHNGVIWSIITIQSS